MPKDKTNYTTDIAHCCGYNCPLKGNCRRFELNVIWEKSCLECDNNNQAFFTTEHYDKEANECKLYMPIE